MLSIEHGSCFQQARGKVGLGSRRHAIATTPHAPRDEPETLHKSAKHFRFEFQRILAGVRLRLPIIFENLGRQRCARIALCLGLLLGALPGNASDGSSSCTASPIADSSETTPLPVQPEAKSPESEKYDVNRIGERNTGKGVNLYSLEKERALGQAMAETIDRQTRFVTEPSLIKYVNRVAQKIIANSDAQVAFTIKVVDSSQLNTFALPGGFLYVDKGLLIGLESEAELSGLIAHEVAHVAARHGTRYATRRSAWNVISFPMIYMAGPGAIGAKQIGPLALRKFARDAELEADLLGMEYQYAAGYDPRAFIDALERLHHNEIQMHPGKEDRATGGFGHTFHQIAKSYAFYPPTEERILRLQNEIATMLPCRDTYMTDTSEFQDIKARLLADEVVLHRDHAKDDGDGGHGGPVLRRHPTEWRQPLTVLTAVAKDANPYIF